MLWIVISEATRSAGAQLAEVERCPAGLPVVAMHDLWHPPLDPLGADHGRGAGEGGEAFGVVIPVATVAIEVGSGIAVEEMRRVQRVEHLVAERAAIDPCEASEEVVPFRHLAAPADRLHHRAIAGHEGAHLDALCRQCPRQGAGHVGQPPGLDQRHAFRGDGQHTGHFSASLRSSIRWVMSVTPPGLTRNHRASSSGSSPTTSPSGMCTPRFMTTFLSRACRATLT